MGLWKVNGEMGPLAQSGLAWAMSDPKSWFELAALVDFVAKTGSKRDGIQGRLGYQGLKEPLGSHDARCA